METGIKKGVDKSTSRDVSVPAEVRYTRLTEEQDDLIHYAFTEYLDCAIDALVKRGLTEKVALDTVFCVVDKLESCELLPNFPEEGSPTILYGEWLVKANDFGFIKFCEEAVG